MYKKGIKKTQNKPNETTLWPILRTNFWNERFFESLFWTTYPPVLFLTTFKYYPENDLKLDWEKVEFQIFSNVLFKIWFLNNYVVNFVDLALPGLLILRPGVFLRKLFQSIRLYIKGMPNGQHWSNKKICNLCRFIKANSNK